MWRVVVVLVLVVVALGGCSLLPVGDPRGEWGYWENARSVGSVALPIKSKPWGHL